MMFIELPVKINIKTAMVIASSDAYPSIPSRKLYRFMNQTMPITANEYRIIMEFNSTPEIITGLISLIKTNAAKAVII
jgi:hypothetical protein